MPRESIFDNGGFIGVTMDFTSDEFYPSSNAEEPSVTPTATHAASGTITPNYGAVDTVFVADLVFPIAPTDGLIWETGGTGQGAWLGIRDTGTTMRLRGGDGATAKTASDTDTAVVDITDFPKDGQTHELMWDFKISTGTARIFIDGELKGQSSATGGSFDNEVFAGSNDGAYITTSTTGVVAGETATANNFTEGGVGLRVYANNLAVTNTNRKNSGIWSLNSTILTGAPQVSLVDFAGVATGAQTMTITYPSVIQPGDFLVLIGYTQDVNLTTDMSAWTARSGGRFFKLYHKVADGTESGNTLTLSHSGTSQGAYGLYVFRSVLNIFRSVLNTDYLYRTTQTGPAGAFGTNGVFTTLNDIPNEFNFLVYLAWHPDDRTISSITGNLTLVDSFPGSTGIWARFYWAANIGGEDCGLVVNLDSILIGALFNTD